MDKSFREVFLLLKKRVWLILASIITTAILAGVISFYFIQPSYSATSQFIVNTDLDERLAELNIDNIRINVELINTYSVVIKSPTILDKVITELNLPMTSKELGEQLEVANAEGSQVVAVTVVDENYERAVAIANTVVEVFKTEISTLMNIDNVQTLSTAQVEADPDPVNLNPLLNIAIGSLLGVMIGTVIAFIKDYMDQSIRTKRDLQKHIDIPVVGMVSSITKKEMKNIKKLQTVGTQNKEGGLLHVVTERENNG